MPWINEFKFIADWLSDDYSKIDLVQSLRDQPSHRRQMDQALPTRWSEGLEELSRAPHCHPNATTEEIREMIIADQA